MPTSMQPEGFRKALVASSPLDGHPNPDRIVNIADDGRQREVIREIPDKGCVMKSAQIPQAAKQDKPSYEHRVAFGCWINDMRSVPVREQWPSARFDAQLEKDLLAAMKLQARSGFNVFDVCGFFATHSWPLDMASSVDSDRKARAMRLIQAAHEMGLKVIHGTGVYSWGFEDIIKADPEVAGTNPQAMCGSKERSWEWTRRVLEFILENFDFDGFHLEASDQGRCTCSECSKYGDVEYYSILNARAADYIRSRAPNKLLLVNMCGYLKWGRRMDPSDYKHLVELSRHIDVLIEPGHYGYFINPADWAGLVPQLHCDFGTSGNVWVYPPQRWDRLRWFLPYTQRTGQHLAHLRSIGGKACEFYMGPAVNPAVEVNIAFGGRFMSDPSWTPLAVLNHVVGELYKPKSTAACQDLAQLFVRAEDAYFNNSAYDLLPAGAREIHMEPLFGVSAGPAIYLGDKNGQGAMSAAGRREYARQLSAISADAAKLRDSCRDEGRIERIGECIRRVWADIEALAKQT